MALLVVDQLEELFTRESITEAEREASVQLLSSLAKSGLVWVIATMRSVLDAEYPLADAFANRRERAVPHHKAALLHDLVTTSSLDGFVESRVKELTGDKQTPVMERPSQEPDFTIARAPR